MDAYPSHWKSTLLGPAFWHDAETYNQPINDAIEAETKKLLHKRFPFTIGPEQPPSSQTIPAPKDINMNKPTDKKELKSHNRRFSLNGALSSPFHAINPFVHGLSHRAHPSLRTSPTDRDPSTTSSHSQSRPSRSRSLIRVPMNMLRGISENRKKQIESELPMLPDDQATAANPFPEFRGGRTWDRLDRRRVSLGLDLFWPVPVPVSMSILPPVPVIRPLSMGFGLLKPAQSPPDHPRQDQDEARHANNNNNYYYKEQGEGNREEEEDDTLPIHELSPLPSFRNLVTLKLVGMTQSYELPIWITAWLNPRLETLELGMALPPTLRQNPRTKWPCIRGGWELTPDKYRPPVYYGQNGTGNLNPTIGLGAYLDKTVIEKAKVIAMTMGRTRNRLSVRTLVLTGFVVDGDPFVQWFDAGRLLWGSE